jgi:hypothetical protein
VTSRLRARSAEKYFVSPQQNKFFTKSAASRPHQSGASRAVRQEKKREGLPLDGEPIRAIRTNTEAR